LHWILTGNFINILRINMLKKSTSSTTVAVLFLLLAIACETDPGEIQKDPYGAGVYVVNEGFFNGNNGSLSYYDPENGTVIHHIFETANGRPAGDVIQSFAVHEGSTGFIVANNSGKVEVLNMSTFETISEPLVASYPRYFMPVAETKGYLTNGSLTGQVYVVDLTDLVITDTIAVGFGPESMAQIDNYVYVCNSGGWVKDSTLSVINAVTDRVEDTFYVGEVPVDIVLDADLNLWVFCKGYATYSWNPPYELIDETPSVLQKINPVSGEILWSHEVGKAGDYTIVPPKLAVSADGLFVFYLRPDGVYRISVTDPLPPDQSVIPGSYYGIEVNPAHGDLYLFEASLAGQGVMRIYDAFLNPVVSQQVGIMPNGAVFVNR